MYDPAHIFSWAYSLSLKLFLNMKYQNQINRQDSVDVQLSFYLFYFIECFTTTFLHTHSWLNWVDEDDDDDEVGLREKQEDTRYIKKITSK